VNSDVFTPELAGNSPSPKAACGSLTPGLAPRLAAFEILLRVEQGAFADALLGHRLPAFGLRDRRLITSLVLGTTAWRARLDYEIDRLLAVPGGNLTMPVRVVLRMGIYQLRFLTRIAHYAVVNSSVALAKHYPHTRPAAGLVNAVLRRASRETVALPDPKEDEVGYLSIAYSHPRWLVERLIEWFGIAKASEIMAADNAPAPNFIRLNLAKGTPGENLAKLESEGLVVDSCGPFPEMAVVRRGNSIDSRAHAEGLFIHQNLASQMVARLLAPAPGAIVLDCAAAPGGKATHLAELVGPSGRVVALDKSASGLRKARQLALKLGHRNILFLQADVTRGVPFAPRSFPFVLLDAPCTGLGTLRSHPEIRWRLRPQDITRMAELQTAMLLAVSELVAPGGILVYAVCSFAPEEGFGVVRRFLSCKPEFSVDPMPFGGLPLATSPDGYLCLSLLPAAEGADGFFAVRLKRSR